MNCNCCNLVYFGLKKRFCSWCKDLESIPFLIEILVNILAGSLGHIWWGDVVIG